MPLRALGKVEGQQAARQFCPAEPPHASLPHMQLVGCETLLRELYATAWS